MELQQFEHLETKIVTLVELARKQKDENRSFSQKLQELEGKIDILSEENNSLKLVNNENNHTLEQIDKLKSEREWIQGKIESLLGRIEDLETELK